MAESAPSHPDIDALPPGRIDLHSHLIPGIDDGCQSFEESFACVRMLRDAGFVATVCTPHIWRDMFPANVPANIEPWTAQVQRRLDDASLDYAVWPGGEVRLYDGIVDWFEAAGVPTLGATRYVLMDFWSPAWPAWLEPTMAWLLDRGYQPILAHPERTPDQPRLLENLRALNDRGVMFQGNCLPYTGAEGREPRRLMKTLLKENRYDLLALDMHGADTLGDRLEGLAQLRKALGDDRLDELTCAAPRAILWDS